MGKNILIIKLGALGDVVMASGLIKQIKRHHRHDNLSLLTSPAYTELFQPADKFELVTYNRKSLLATLSIIRWCRQKGFARLYDLQSNDRTRVICSLSGIPEKVGTHPHYPYNMHPNSVYAGQCHIHSRMLEVLRAAGLSFANADPCLSPDEQHHNRASRWLRQQGLLNRRFVIMHGGASRGHPEKRWPYFSDLALRLKTAGLETLWIGGKDEGETNRLLAEITGVNGSGAFSLLELVALTQHARFAVTNDSGPMHVLACGKIPVYGFFGPTDWRRNHAVGHKHHVLSLNRREPVFRETNLAELHVDHVVDILQLTASI